MLNERAKALFSGLCFCFTDRPFTLALLPILSFLLAGWSLCFSGARGRQPPPSCSLGFGCAPGAAQGQREHFGGSQLQSCRWFCYLQAGARSHFILPFPGLHPAPEGSASTGLTQNGEINDVSLKHHHHLSFDHLISVVWFAHHWRAGAWKYK